jgi:hypothetical protein
VGHRGAVDVLDLLHVQAGLDLSEHEPVPVVIVARVLVIEVGIDAAIGRPFGLVPVVDHQHLAVGILGWHDQEHGVVQNLPDLGRVLGRETIHDERNGLAVSDLGRMNGGVEEVERPALVDERLRLVLGEPTRVGEAVLDLDETVEMTQVLGRAHRDENVVVSHRRLAQLFEQDPIGIGRDVLQVIDDARIGCHLPVGPEPEPEKPLGSLDGLGGEARCPYRKGTDDEPERHRAHPSLHLSCPHVSEI